MDFFHIIHPSILWPVTQFGASLDSLSRKKEEIQGTAGKAMVIEYENYTDPSQKQAFPQQDRLSDLAYEI